MSFKETQHGNRYFLGLTGSILWIIFCVILFISLTSATDWEANLNDEIRSYYTLNEINGIRYDSVNSSAGLYNANPSGSGDLYNPSGKIEASIRGDGINKLNAGNVLAGTEALTISFWAKKDGTSGYNNRFIGAGENFNVNFNDCLQGSRNELSVTINNQCINPNWIMGDNFNWHYFVVSIDGGAQNADFYKDNFLTASVSLNGKFNNLINSLCFLSYDCFNVGADISFYLDEVGIWTRKLNSSEMNQLWNDGNGLSFNHSFLSELPPSQDVVANLTARINNLSIQLDQLEQQNSVFGQRLNLLEDWKNITNTIVNTLQQSLIAFPNYFKYFDSADRKKLVCSYAKDKNLTTYNDLGWGCSLTRKPLKNGGESLTCDCVAL